MQRSKSSLLLQSGRLNRNMVKEWSSSPKSMATDNFIGKCLTAYATLDRFSGKCGLIILWEKELIRKELEFHTFLLSFNYEGIKAYTVKKLVFPYGKYCQDEMKDYVQIEFQEAVSLLQDAYRQNIRFGTAPARGWENYRFFLEYETSGLEGVELLHKLVLNNLTPLEFTNVYLAALKRMDYVLLYDLSSFRRKKNLGSREDFFCTSGEKLANYNFLKSKVLNMAKQGDKEIILASIMVGTPQDEIIKIDYKLVLFNDGGVLYLDDFQELNRTALAEDHPENPMNYRVFCSVYSISGQTLIRNWLESNPDIFLTGEFDKGMCYKFLKAEEHVRNCFDVTAGIISEFILTEKEMIVYASRPFNLVQMEYLLTKELKERVKFKQKYYLPVRKLYKAVILGGSLEVLLKRSSGKFCCCSFKAEAAFLYWKGKRQIADKLQTEATYKLLLEQDNWYFLEERKKGGDEESISFIEYYVSGNWLRLNVYNANLEEELKKLKPQAEVIVEYELADYYDLFNPPLSVERKWKICRMLNLMGRQASILKRMGIVPSVKGTARRLGALVQ